MRFVNRLDNFSEELTLEIIGVEAMHILRGTVVYYDTYKEGYLLGIRFHELDSDRYRLWVKEVYGKTPPEEMFMYRKKTGLLNVILT